MSKSSSVSIGSTTRGDASSAGQQTSGGLSASSFLPTTVQHDDTSTLKEASSDEDDLASRIAADAANELQPETQGLQTVAPSYSFNQYDAISDRITREDIDAYTDAYADQVQNIQNPAMLQQAIISTRLNGESDRSYINSRDSSVAPSVAPEEPPPTPHQDSDNQNQLEELDEFVPATFQSVARAGKSNTISNWGHTVDSDVLSNFVPASASASFAAAEGPTVTQQEATADNLEDAAEPVEEKDTGKVTPTYTPRRQPALAAAQSNFRSVMHDIVDKVKNSFGSRDLGEGIDDKLLGDASVRMDQVAIGYENIEDILKHPGSEFHSRILEETGADITNMTVEEVASVVNQANIRVACYKHPINRSSSFQSPILRINTDVGRGVLLHPIMFKSYNADADGDEMIVAFSASAAKKGRHPMKYIIDVDGTLTIDPDFFPHVRIFDEHSQYLFERLMNNHYLKKYPGRVALFKTLTNFYKSQNAGDDDGAAAYLEQAVRQIYDMAKNSAEAGVGEGNVPSVNDIYNRMGYILSEVYKGCRRSELATIHQQLGMSYEGKLPKPKSRHDKALYETLDALDGMVRGTDVVNYQDLKKLYCAYAGEVDGKNIDFRFTANIAKLFKFDSRIMAGEEGLEHVMKQLVQFHYSQKMSKSSYDANDYKSINRFIKDRVMNFVGGYGAINIETGDTIYRSFQEFLGTFVEAYSEMADLLEEANYVAYLDGSVRQSPKALSKNSAGWDVENPNAATVVSAFTKMYEDLTLDKVFGGLISFGVDMKRLKDGKQERNIWEDNGLFFINVRYANMTLGQFARKNNFRLNKDEQNKRGAKPFSELNFNEFLELIADQKTKNASYFNRKMFMDEGCATSKALGAIQNIRESVDKVNNVTEFRGSNYFLSNFFDCPNGVTIDDIKYKNAEAAFQAQKVADKEAFANLSGKDAKARGRKTPMVYSKEEWNAIRDDVMKKVVAAKFDQNPNLMSRLRRTVGTITEGNTWGDKYWGVDKKTGAGENKLGQILMDIRGESMPPVELIRVLKSNLDVLRAFGSDMFAHFGMDNVSSFYASSWGKKLLQAKTNDHVANIRLMMSLQYRMDVVQNAINKINEAHQSGAKFETIARAQNEALNEISKLKSSSAAWNAIVNEEARGKEESIFMRLKSGATAEEVFGKGSSKNYDKWTAGIKEESLLDALMNPQIPYQDKINMLSDVVRADSGDIYINSWEMAYQIEQGPGSQYASMSAMPSNVLDVVSEVNKASTSASVYRGSMNTLSIEAFEDWHEKNPEFSVVDAFRSIAKHPESMVVPDDRVFTDSLVGCIDKMFAQSEKSKQHELVCNLFKMNSKTRNGGYFDDEYRANARAIGVIDVNTLTAGDVARLFTDPEFTLKVHNDLGASIVLSQKAIFGDEPVTDEAIINKLYEYPSLVNLFTKKGVSIIDKASSDPTKDVEYEAILTDYSFAYDARLVQGLTAACSAPAIVPNRTLTDLYDGNNAIKNYLYDKPEYGAIVALFTKTANSSASVMASRYVDTNEMLINSMLYVIKESFSAGETSMEDVDVTPFIEETFGLTEQAIIDAGHTKEIAKEVHDQVCEFYNRYVRYISTLYDPSVFTSIDTTHVRISKAAIDWQSVSAYYSVRQELNGAKTEVSTGVEGMETSKYAIWAFILDNPDKYDLANQYIDVDAMHELNPMTSVGPFNDIDWSQYPADVEIVMELPEGFTKKDKFLDDYGRQVSSLGAYLMVKRDDGAERLNLKIKKMGMDPEFLDKEGTIPNPGFDSIVKFDRLLDDVNYQNIFDGLSVENCPSLFEAKIRLANILKDANEKLGYKDMDLANYVNIADIMLISTVDEAGNEVRDLRSVSQVLTAIHNQMPKEAVARANIKELRELAHQIATSVTSDYALSLSDVFNSVRPLQSYVHFDESRSRNPHTSAPTRNFGELMRIMRQAGFKKRFSKADVEEMEKRIVNYANGVEAEEENAHGFFARTERAEQARAIQSLRSSVTVHGYNLVGLAGSNLIWDQPGIRSCIIATTGPLTDKKQVIADIERALSLGISVMMNHVTYMMLPEKLQALVSSGRHGDEKFIQGFEVRLNNLLEASNPKFAIFQADPDNLILSHEDICNEYSLPDAGAQLYKHLTGRLHAEDSGEVNLRAEVLFPNATAMYPDAYFSLGIASKPRVQELFINKSQPVSVDFGVPETDIGFNKAVRNFENKYEQWLENVDQLDEFGYLANAKPGDIVAWAELTIVKDGKTKYCYAPIIPFPDNGSHSVPSDYRMEGLGSDGSTISFNWRYSGSMEGQYLKIHEWAGAANKMTATVDSAVEKPALLNGMQLDMCYARESTASRRGGSNKRMASLETLYFVSRMEGYNFAKTTKSFPNSPALKERLMTERIPRSEWADIINDDSFRWYGSRGKKSNLINSFVKQQVKKFYDNGGNPSDFLASVFYDENGRNPRRTDVWWEFLPMASTSDVYQEGFMSFINCMLPKMCQASPSDPWTNQYFKASTDGGFEEGCLQMQVPHIDPEDGSVFYLWENVYAGWTFFGSEFSGFHRPNIGSSSTNLSALNTMALAGQMPTNFQFKQMLKWAYSDYDQMRGASGSIEWVR